MDESIAITLVITVVSIALGLLVPAVVIWKVVLPIFKNRADKQQLLATGMPAEATVMAMQDTGTRINDNPMLNLTVNIEVSGRAVYQVTVQDIVPFMLLGMIAPGNKFPARVDPTNPQRVAIDWTGQHAAPQVEQGGVARLLATGLAGQAQIVSCEPLPMPPVGADTMWKFTVQVQVPDGRPVFSVTMGQRVPSAVNGRFGPSVVVPCKVDPRNPAEVVLDFWSWAGIPAPQLPAQVSNPYAPQPAGAPASPYAPPMGAPPGAPGGWPGAPGA